MNPEAKEIWASALESGRYIQGRGRLCRGGRYCCLGVLSEEAIRAGVRVQVTTYQVLPGEAIKAYDGADTYPPDSVLEWAGLDSHNPYVDHPQHGRQTLADLNDTFNVQFQEIAKLIREQF